MSTSSIRFHMKVSSAAFDSVLTVTTSQQAATVLHRSSMSIAESLLRICKIILCRMTGTYTFEVSALVPTENILLQVPKTRSLEYVHIALA